MAQFWGTVQGGRGEAERGGSKKSGMRAVAASWQGAIKVLLHHDEATGRDHFSVEQTLWQGKGKYESLASGEIGKPSTVAELRGALEQARAALTEGTVTQSMQRAVERIDAALKAHTF